MSDGDEFRQSYNIGDTANGYVLTPEGWKPIPPTSSGGTPTMPIGTDATQELRTGANPQYRIGDVANGYVLTPQGWQPVGQAPAHGPASGPAYGPAASPGAGGSGSRPSRRGLYIALAIAAVVILGVAAAGTYAWVSLQSTIAQPRTPTSSSRSTTRPPATSTTRPTTSPTSRPGSSSTTAAAAAKTFKFGESGKVTLKGAPAGELKVDKPVEFKPASDFDTPERGRLVYVPVTIKVTGQSPVTISDLDFVAVLPSGERLDSAIVLELPKEAPPQLDSSSVKVGETLTASVAFDVPKDVALKIGYVPDQDVIGSWSD